MFVAELEASVSIIKINISTIEQFLLTNPAHERRAGLEHPNRLTLSAQSEGLLSSGQKQTSINYRCMLRLQLFRSDLESIKFHHQNNKTPFTVAAISAYSCAPCVCLLTAHKLGPSRIPQFGSSLAEA